MNLHQRLDVEAAPLWALPRIEARDRLIEHYRPIAMQAAAKRAKRQPLVSPDEYVSESLVALWQCVEAFDPQNVRGASFTTFAHCRIRCSLIEAERANDWVKPKIREKEKRGQIELPGMGCMPDTFDVGVSADEQDDPVEQLSDVLRNAPVLPQWIASAWLEARGDVDALADALGTSDVLAARLQRWAVSELQCVAI